MCGPTAPKSAPTSSAALFVHNLHDTHGLGLTALHLPHHAEGTFTLEAHAAHAVHQELHREIPGPQPAYMAYLVWSRDIPRPSWSLSPSSCPSSQVIPSHPKSSSPGTQHAQHPIVVLGPSLAAADEHLPAELGAVFVIGLRPGSVHR